jgi:hypothetical protein
MPHFSKDTCARMGFKGIAFEGVGLSTLWQGSHFLTYLVVSENKVGHQ